MSNKSNQISGYEKVNLINSESAKPVENLGVYGQYEWPIRLLTPILFACTLFTNYTLGISKNKQVSDRFHLWVTPPGYFFAIWGIIYTGLISMTIYNLLANIWNQKTHLYFAISNLLNILWTIVFINGTLQSIVIASFILILMTYFIFLTWVEMGNIPNKQINILTYVMRNVWAFYLGWCIAASNLSLGHDIVYWWGVGKQTQLIVFWIMAPLCAIAGFGYNWVKYGKYGALSCFSLWFSVVWAFIGAGITSSRCLNGNC